jgi:hypothetical protein
MRHMAFACLVLTAGMWLSASISPAQAADQPAAHGRMLDLPMTIAHTEVMKVPPERLWREIKRLYVDGQKFSSQGYTVEPLTDAASWMGGTRVSRTHPDGRLEERVARISALDDAKRFLALSVHYSEGFAVRASYEVHPDPAGAAFRLIAHVDQPFNLAADDEAGRRQLQEAAQARMVAETKGLADAWAAERVRIEREQ